MPEVNRTAVRKYVRAGGVFCPRCRSTDITGGFVEIDEGKAFQPVRCEECGFSWRDVYTLTGIEAEE